MSNDISLIEVETNQTLVQSDSIHIDSQLTLEKASDFLKSVKGLQKKIKETFDPIISKALAAHREAIGQRDKHLDPVNEAESRIKGKINTYLSDCERKRREEELKLQAIAEEKARKEQAELEARAKKWEEKGKVEKAEALKEQAQQVEVIVPVVAPTVQKVNGISTRKIWKARVLNITEISRDYMIVNQPLLDSIARSTKGTMVIAGVQFYSEDIINARS